MIGVWKQLIVISVAYLVCSLAIARGTIDSSTSLTVLVWNLHKEADSTMQANLRVIADDADLLLFQEAYFSSDYYSMLAPLEIDHWDEATAFRLLSSEGLIGTGVSTGGKWMSLSSTDFPSDTVEPIIGTSKQSLISYYALKDSASTLLVINTHAINFVTSGEFDHEMRRLAEVIEKHDGPMIWAGDFNTWNFTRLEHLLTAIDDLGLEAVRFLDGSRKTFNGHPLDHVFYRGLTVKKVHDYMQLSSSDHLPLKVTFNFIKRPKKISGLMTN